MASEHRIGFCEGCSLGQAPEDAMPGDLIVEVGQYPRERPEDPQHWLCDFCAGTPFGNLSRARGISLDGLRRDLHEALSFIYHSIRANPGATPDASGPDAGSIKPRVLKEGQSKGGQNDPPTTPRPTARPKPQRPRFQSRRVRIKPGWDRAGQEGVTAGPDLRINGIVWTPLVWDEEEDPDFHKTRGLEFLEADNV